MNDDAPDTQPPPPDPVLVALESILHDVGELRVIVEGQVKRLDNIAKAVSDVAHEAQRLRKVDGELERRVIPLERHLTPAAGMGAVRP
jgi:hypothetical protein